MGMHSPSRRCCLQRLAGAALLGAGAGAGAGTLSQTADLPADSIYHLRAQLTDQDSHALELDFGRGAPLLVSMFYSSCEGVCPVIFQTLQLTLQALPVDPAARLKLLLVSFDPARDDAARLKASALAHGCDGRWTLAHSDPAHTRQIAALLGVQYRRLSSGEFNHSSLITLLDDQGRIVARSSRLGTPDPGLLAALRRQLRAATTAAAG